MYEYLPLLLLAACPIGMGLMMWFMMRGQHAHHASPPAAGDAELMRLRAELDQLRTHVASGNRSASNDMTSAA